MSVSFKRTIHHNKIEVLMLDISKFLSFKGIDYLRFN